MILVVDVAYKDNSAQVAGVLLESWDSCISTNQYIIHIQNIAEYESGQFYKRELPCILALLDVVKEDIEFIVIDGYVYLGAEQSAGLGQHLYDSLINKVPVIGVAKNEFRDTPEQCKILRGESRKPLFITSIGIDLKLAKNNIGAMSGKHRIPIMLKEVDRLSRSQF